MALYYQSQVLYYTESGPDQVNVNSKYSSYWYYNLASAKFISCSSLTPNEKESEHSGQSKARALCVCYKSPLSAIKALHSTLSIVLKQSQENLLCALSALFSHGLSVDGFPAQVSAV